MKQRFISVVVMLTMLFSLLYIAPIEIAVLSMVLITFLACLELINISKNDKLLKYKNIIAFMGGLSPIFIYIGNYFELVNVCIMGVIAYIYLKEHENISYSDVSLMICTVYILPYAINCITRIYFIDYGNILVLIPMISAWASDVFAYLVGRTFGKNKLAPTISPNKTIEGSIGGIAGSAIIMLIYGYIINDYVSINWIILIFMGSFGSVLGQFGDLFFSMIKRQTKIKDYSNLIPGHGGILDRFDSVIFTAPLALAILNLI